MATKIELRSAEHLEELRRRVAFLERTRPGDNWTKQLAGSLATVERQYQDKAVFAADLGLTEITWSGRNLTRLLKSTGERPDRVEEMRAILDALGLGDLRGWPGKGGVFDHGTFWGQRTTCGSRSSLVPFALVGHPYAIHDATAGYCADERGLLAELAKYPTLHVAVDDRPSFYGFGTHHVRVSVPGPRASFRRGVSTTTTRAAARAARRAFAEEGLPATEET